VLAAFRAARAKTVKLISGFTAGQLSRTAAFECYGTVALRCLLHYQSTFTQAITSLVAPAMPLAFPCDNAPSNKLFGNLYGVERRALANIVGDNP
jgi:hypothetical protein